MLEPDVEAAARRSSNWDRKLASSILELRDLQTVMKKYQEDPDEMKKQIKRVRKFHKSPLATIKVLDIPKEDLTESITPVTVDPVNEDSLES